MAEETERDGRDQEPHVAFDYIKGQLFHVVHADGVIGGLTPNGSVHVAFFSERSPIPQREVRAISSDGTLGDLIVDQTVVRPAIVREVDVDVMLALPVAELLITWLQDRVSELKNRIPPDGRGKGKSE
jgi:hypothetical protein